MARSWPNFFSSTSIKTQKGRRLISSHLVNRKCSVSLLYGQKDNFYLLNNSGNPERERWVHLARSGSQSEHRIRFVLSARGFNDIIIGYRMAREDKLNFFFSSVESISQLHSLMKYFSKLRRNFVSRSGHVMFCLLYKHQWNTKPIHFNSCWLREPQFIATLIFSRVKIYILLHGFVCLESWDVFKSHAVFWQARRVGQNPSKRVKYPTILYAKPYNKRFIIQLEGLK